MAPHSKNIISANRTGFVQVDVAPQQAAKRTSWWKQLKVSFGKIFGDKKTVVEDLANLKAAAAEGGSAWLRQHASKNEKMEAEIIHLRAQAERERATTLPDVLLADAKTARERAETRKIEAETRALDLDVQIKKFDFTIRAIAELKTIGMEAVPICEPDGSIGLAIRDTRTLALPSEPPELASAIEVEVDTSDLLQLSADDMSPAVAEPSHSEVLALAGGKKQTGSD